jgi:hypothetical protein
MCIMVEHADGRGFCACPFPLRHLALAAWRVVLHVFFRSPSLTLLANDSHLPSLLI